MNKQKILMVLGALFVLLLICGGAFFLGNQQRTQTNESQSVIQPTAQPIEQPTLQATPSGTTVNTTPTITVTLTSTPTKGPTSTPTTTSSPTPTPAPAVINIEDSVSPSSINTCNGTFTFTGKIYTNGATTVTYRWIRSDGANGATKTLTFANASMQTVTDSWTIGQTPNHHYNGWERIEILTPNATLGNLANFTISCP